MKKLGKRRVFAIMLVGVLAIVLLAAGIPSMRLSPGKPWEFWRQLLFGGMQLEHGTPPALFSGEGLIDAMRVVFLSVFILIPVLIVAIIISPELRKKALREFLRAALLAAIVLLVFRSGAIETLTGTIPEVQEIAEDALPEEGSESYLEEMPEFAPDPPAFVIWLASFVLALLVLAVGGSIGWYFWQDRLVRRYPVRELAQDAQDALDALQAGEDFRNTVIRCYYEMSEALEERRGIRRETAMTPREFEVRLTAHGLPGPSVRQLTRLFEAVRYGAVEPGDLQVDQAVTCLSAIIAACRAL